MEANELSQIITKQGSSLYNIERQDKQRNTCTCSTFTAVLKCGLLVAAFVIIGLYILKMNERLEQLERRVATLENQLLTSAEVSN